MWRATSKVLLSAGSWTIDHPNSHGTRIRWPLLETGANSVMPWVRPRTIACKTVNGVSFRSGGAPSLSGGRCRSRRGRWRWCRARLDPTGNEGQRARRVGLEQLPGRRLVDVEGHHGPMIPTEAARHRLDPQDPEILADE